MAEAEKLTLVCPECGELMEVSDPRAVLLSEHLANFCPSTAGIVHERPDS